MKGIILAGGTGSRLHPATRAVNKQLRPVYDKPMMYYPLSTLMLAGIREILIVCRQEDMRRCRHLLGDGGQWGLSLTYFVQAQPNGIAEALILGAEILNGAPVMLVLGDNLFFGHGLPDLLRQASAIAEGARIFAHAVNRPERYGEVAIDSDEIPVSIEEKPATPRSTWPVTGLYVYGRDASSIAAGLAPSDRSELEITDMNRAYLARGTLSIERLGRDYAWLDTGEHDALLEAGEFVRTIQRRQGLQVACVEEIAFNQGFIDREQLVRLAAPLANTGYGQSLRRLVGASD